MTRLMKRRDFLRWTAASGSVLLAGTTWSDSPAGTSTTPTPRSGRKKHSLEEMTVAELQRVLTSGRFTAAALVRRYLKRIEEVEGGARIES